MYSPRRPHVSPPRLALWTPWDASAARSSPGCFPTRVLATRLRRPSVCWRPSGPSRSPLGSSSQPRLASATWRPAKTSALHRAARVHDAGKQALPEALLSCPGSLTASETSHVRRHATIGAALAARVLDSEQEAWIRHHHERPDGSGYHSGLVGDAIPNGARIIAMADVANGLDVSSGRVDADDERPRVPQLQSLN